MANTHGVVNTTHCSCWTDDALNFSGVAEKDIDNGTFVALGDLQKTDGFINEYTFTVTPDANGTSTIKYIVDTQIGKAGTLEQQLYNDPRYFYNIAGRAMSIKQLLVGNCVEISAEAMVTGATPVDQPTYTTASIGAEGKLQMVSQSGDFKYMGAVERAIGQEVVPHYVFMLMA